MFVQVVGELVQMEQALFRGSGFARPGVLWAGQVQMELAPFRMSGFARPGVLRVGQV